MRSRARLWAAADFGVRFSYVAISFCSASCIGVLRHSRSVPCGQCMRKNRWAWSWTNLILTDERRRSACPGRLLKLSERYLAPFPQRPKKQFQCELEQSRVTHLLRLAEGWVGGPAIHSIELGVIEDVEDFRPEFQTRLFSNRSIFKQSHIPIVNRGVAAESARSVAEGSQRAVGKIGGIEDQTVDARVVSLEWAEHIRFSRTFEAKCAPFQFGIIAVVDQDREAALIRVDAGNLPAIQRFPLKSLVLGNRKLPDVVKDEAVARIEERWSIGCIKICWVQNLLEAGGVVERFAVGVGGLELQAVRETLLE